MRSCQGVKTAGLSSQFISFLFLYNIYIFPSKSGMGAANIGSSLFLFTKLAFPTKSCLTCIAGVTGVITSYRERCRPYFPFSLCLSRQRFCFLRKADIPRFVLLPSGRPGPSRQCLRISIDVTSKCVVCKKKITQRFSQ